MVFNMILPKSAVYSSQNLDHLGLVAGTINQLNIVDEIDKVPIEKQRLKRVVPEVISGYLRARSLSS